MEINILFFSVKNRKLLKITSNWRQYFLFLFHCYKEHFVKVKTFCIIVLVIIAYGVGISRITVNDNVKCDVEK
jgi:hypothetical protein